MPRAGRAGEQVEPDRVPEAVAEFGGGGTGLAGPADVPAEFAHPVTAVTSSTASGTAGLNVTRAPLGGCVIVAGDTRASGETITMRPAHAKIPPSRQRRTGPAGDLLPLGDWIRHHSLRSWPVLLFLLLICVPSIALVILGPNPSASTFDHVAWIFAAYFAVAWLLLLGIIIRPEHVTRPMLVLVTVIALATQVPLAVTLEADLHAETAGLGASIYSVGLPEELAKAIPVLAVAVIYRLWLYRPSGRHELTPKDYLFLGAVSGLVFGASEVVHYFTVNGLAEFYLTVQSALPSIQQLIITGHSAPDSVFAVLIGPVRYFVLDFVLAVPHRPDHPRLLGRPDRLLHRAGGHRAAQVVHRELDRAGHRRDPARAERLEPGQRPLAVDRGHHRQRHPVPGLREGRVPQRPGGSRPLAARASARRPGRGRPALVGALTASRPEDARTRGQPGAHASDSAPDVTASATSTTGTTSTSFP